LGTTDKSLQRARHGDVVLKPGDNSHSSTDLVTVMYKPSWNGVVNSHDQQNWREFGWELFRDQ